jgi:hypothetical protein
MRFILVADDGTCVQASPDVAYFGVRPLIKRAGRAQVLAVLEFAD